MVDNLHASTPLSMKVVFLILTVAMFAKKPKMQVNFLDLVPERTMEWETTEEGRVQILIPKFGKNPVGAWIGRRLRKPYIKIRLDEIGSAVWNACDGQNAVRQIAAMLENQFGDEIKPAYDRLSEFFKQLEYNKFIRWKNLA